MPSKLIQMDNSEMLLFIDMMQKEYNEKGIKTDKQINIDNVLYKVFNHE